VTALVEPELEEPVLAELVAGVDVVVVEVVVVVGVEVEVEVEVVVVGVEVVVVVGVVVVAFWAVVWRASAGSWPLTSVMVISSQVATNSASVPATTRRRSVRTRARRACLMEVASVGVMATGSAARVATA
jgi:hypothetical protein